MKQGEAYATEKSHFFSNNNLEIIGENKSNMCFEVEELEVFIVTY